MTFRWFLLIMTFATIAAWIGWTFVLHAIDPIQTNMVGFVLFYFTLFTSLLGTTVLFGTLLRLWLRPREIPYRQTVRAFRQGVWLSLLAIFTLLLLSFELLRWWSVILLVLLFGLLELFFVSRKQTV